MRTKSRSRPIQFLSLFLAVWTCLLFFLAAVKPLPVLAAKNKKIDGLIMVQPYSDNHMAKMESAVKSQWANEGTLDANQHTWLYSLDDVLSHVSADQEIRSKHPVVIWAAGGTKWLDTKDTATFGSYYNRSNIGSDSDAGYEIPNYNGTGFGRMLYGYDYQYKFTWNVWRVNGQKVYDEDYSANPNSGTDKCKDGSNPNIGANPTPVYTCDSDEQNNHASHACSDVHDYEKDASGNYVLDASGNQIDVCGNPAHHGHSEHEHCSQKTEEVVRTFHVEGVIEKWHKTYPDLKVYIFSTGPRSKEYFANEVLATSQIEMSEELNKNPQAFNQALDSLSPDYIEAFSLMYENNPYFAVGNDSKVGGNPDYYYSDEFYRFIFHMFWNTVLTLNPNDEPPEPIDETIYSLSSSLTAYMNNVLSSSAKEADDGSTHVLGAASTDYVGNAGAFLGYQDSDYGKSSFITGKHSKTSSVIDYQALLGIEGQNAATSTNEMYLYARYGYLLKDLGLDDTSTRLTFGSSRMIPGALMFLVYSISEGIVMVFEKVIGLLQLLNPFQFFKNASSISLAEKTAMTGSSTASISAKLLNFVGRTYDVLSGFGLGVTIPLFLVLFLAGAILFRRKDTADRAKSLCIRILFVCIGVPVMGALYTSALDNIEDFTATSVSSGTQLVASTFVDFKGWASQYRLSPLQDDINGNGSMEKTVLVSDADDGSKIGQASDASYSKLRRTAVVINKKTGAVTDVNWSGFALNDVQRWMTHGLTKDGNTSARAFKQGAALLQSYTMGDFYTAGAFESDTMSALSKKHSDKLGRQQGLDETDSVDNTDTVFEMFSETNTLDSWTGRTNDENVSIFKQSDDYASKWQAFNLFANGGLKADNNKADDTSNVTYSSGRMNIQHNMGVCPDSKTGLSSVSMYNYLSTTFQDGQMIVYSNKKAASEYTKQQHYAVNLIGSGVARILYYLSCFSCLFVSAIIGVYYAVVLVIQNLKRSVKLLMSIPGAMMGSLQSIVSVVVMCVLMVVELVVTMVVYMFVSELLVTFVQMIEGPVASWVNDAVSTALVGGHVANLGAVNVCAMAGTKLGLFVNLGVSSFGLILLGCFLKHKSYAFVSAYSLCSEYLLLRYVLPESLCDVYLQKNGGICRRRPMFHAYIVWHKTHSLLDDAI